MVFILSPATEGYRVTHIDYAEDGAGLQASVNRLFTAPGAAAVLRGFSPDDPDSVDRAAFGLTDSAPISP
ncbi:hypothetical protein [Amycolatopsis sp. H20-H5]|uniref:hypothetical protein n=1 Tax=Amycolatopsis sp. H20-H5 TaxID=3046309 RepID=UPI002DB73A36|nr:hypothetical protein [Amycolatopsis sp. H20-H5]MEC3980144.1 hypothetical protein [Amycolatopsis sp. H20-H5]